MDDAVTGKTLQLLMTDEYLAFCCDLKSPFQSLKNNHDVSTFIAFSREHLTNAEQREKILWVASHCKS